MSKEKEKKSDKQKEKDAKLEAAMSAMDQIRQKFGEGSIMKFGESRKTDVDAVPTGCLSLDLALGINGIPRFILIDPNGNIVTANAPRPSSKELTDMFTELGI